MTSPTADEVLRAARVLGGRGAARSAVLRDVDRDVVRDDGSATTCRVAFPAPVADAHALHMTMRDLVREARARSE